MAITASTTRTAAQLRLAIARTARRLRQEAGVGLSPSQGAALVTIERHGPLTPSEIASIERIQRPTATRLIAKLEDAGLVVRHADPVDGRSCLVGVTEQGAALLASSRAHKDAFLAKRLRRLDAEDRATLARAAELLEGLLAQEDGERG
ncbi:MAG: MarR family winged helix-turn-helix transcriptional regulator [Solirubrobacteraceae bacterium]